jgi:hypothetical protein
MLVFGPILEQDGLFRHQHLCDQELIEYSSLMKLVIQICITSIAAMDPFATERNSRQG